MRQQHDNFVTSQASHSIDFAHTSFHPFRSGMQQRIADVMAAGIVDGLELVKIDKQQCQACLVTARGTSAASSMASTPSARIIRTVFQPSLVVSRRTTEAIKKLWLLVSNASTRPFYLGFHMAANDVGASLNCLRSQINPMSKYV